jgi:endo-1,4-beta-xylanase
MRCSSLDLDRERTDRIDMPHHRTECSKPSDESLTRRSLLKAGAAGLAASLIGGRNLPAEAQTTKLGRRRVPFGAALQREHFLSDPDYAALFVRHCDHIFPMNDLKWESLRYERDVFNFDPSDEIVSFAENLERTTHGHTFVWFMALPEWVRGLSSTLEAERVLVEHIEKTAAHYAGRIQTWDVVNEVIAFDPKEMGNWRDSVWQQLLGPLHVDMAFRAAKRGDPAALLGINDFDLEFKGDRYDRRRALVLDLVRHLQDQNIAVDYVGFQGHLYPEIPIDGPGTARFIRDLEALGVRYMITELDVVDWKLPVDPGRRDLMAAAHVDDFLDATFSAALPMSVSTWGMSDRYSWISEVMPHRQGAANRPLPFDSELKPKPMFEVIERYLKA